MSGDLVGKFDLTGRVAVVTGAGSGIGRGTALALRALGCTIVVGDLDLAKGEITVEQLGGPDAACAIELDVTDPASCAALAEATIARYGRLDFLVNSAGVYPSRPVLDVDEAHWDLIIDVNLKGTFFMSQACARAMVAAGNGGSIVNISSWRGLHADKAVSVYSASKAGVISLTVSMAQALAEHRVRVNVVAPGVIYTEATDQASKALSQTGVSVKQMQEEFAKTIPLQRFGLPSDVADAVAFLVSDASTYMTGSVVSVDGGGY
ncbi:MAG TPA: SDR family oxidoreductase [Ilumatobacteraceae bacterium]